MVKIEFSFLHRIRFSFELVSQEHFFKDKYLFYRFYGDENGSLVKPTPSEQTECEDQLNDVILTLAQVGPDAMLRMILRKPYDRKTKNEYKRIRFIIIVLDHMNVQLMI